MRLRNRLSWPMAVMLAAVLSVSVGHAAAPAVDRQLFGQMPDGQPVDAYTLRNHNGMQVRVLTYGGIIQSVDVPDRHGRSGDVVLGFGTLGGYLQTSAKANLYFGALIGRYANRIAHGTFILDGHTYHTSVNLPPHTLHGGMSGFDKRVWTVIGTSHNSNSASITLGLISPDGDQGFPGTLRTTVTYILGDTNSLTLHFKATTDKSTVVSLTSHSFWNLGGEGSGSVENEMIQIRANRFTPTDATGVPTGEIQSVTDTPMDFRKAIAVGTHLRDAYPQMLMDNGYDKNFVISGRAGSAPRLSTSVYDPKTGRQLELLTTQPGQQFYTSNGLDGHYAGISGKAYRQTDALALEAEAFPDSPNHPNFPSAILRPGQTYDQTTIYQFSTR